MFETLRFMELGKQAEAHGKQYVLLMHFHDNFYLAVENNADLPCNAQIIYYDSVADFKRELEKMEDGPEKDKAAGIIASLGTLKKKDGGNG
jgi:hypothetical protein